MRIVTVLLITTCFTNHAFAQLAPLNPTSPAATGTATAPASMVNGKFQVGFDGRGDYAKNAKLEKDPAGTAPNTASAPGTPPIIGNSSASVPPSPVPVAVAAPAPAAAVSTPPAMRSDSALISDSSKAKAAAAAAASSAAATTAAAPKPAPAATNNGPMILVGGQIQRQ